MPLIIVFFEASKLVSTKKTLLLKHDYRRQGKTPGLGNPPVISFSQNPRFTKPTAALREMALDIPRCQWRHPALSSAGTKRGRQRGATAKKSKIVKTIFDTF